MNGSKIKLNNKFIKKKKWLFRQSQKENERIRKERKMGM